MVGAIPEIIRKGAVRLNADEQLERSVPVRRIGERIGALRRAVGKGEFDELAGGDVHWLGGPAFPIQPMRPALRAASC